ncbi:hypothetical protein ADM99_15435 [Leptolinea tardivitalis]|uniref:Uncharacterized protein n=1 Tax=Leptolinea tardivitalis TaxID=229920 RepID=A0A0P6X6F1_9CHLR|nr:hypothetical protein ADM99_15435 [Leptolinea tardivitalis]
MKLIVRIRMRWLYCNVLWLRLNQWSECFPLSEPVEGGLGASTRSAAGQPQLPDQLNHRRSSPPVYFPLPEPVEGGLGASTSSATGRAQPSDELNRQKGSAAGLA